MRETAPFDELWRALKDPPTEGKAPNWRPEGPAYGPVKTFESEAVAAEPHHQVVESVLVALIGVVERIG